MQVDAAEALMRRWNAQLLRLEEQRPPSPALHSLLAQVSTLSARGGWRAGLSGPQESVASLPPSPPPVAAGRAQSRPPRRTRRAVGGEAVDHHHTATAAASTPRAVRQRRMRRWSSPRSQSQSRARQRRLPHASATIARPPSSFLAGGALVLPPALQRHADDPPTAPSVAQLCAQGALPSAALGLVRHWLQREVALVQALESVHTGNKDEAEGSELTTLLQVLQAASAFYGAAWHVQDHLLIVDLRFVCLCLRLPGSQFVRKFRRRIAGVEAALVNTRARVALHGPLRDQVELLWHAFRERDSFPRSVVAFRELLLSTVRVWAELQANGRREASVLSPPNVPTTTDLVQLLNAVIADMVSAAISYADTAQVVTPLSKLAERLRSVKWVCRVASACLDEAITRSTTTGSVGAAWTFPRFGMLSTAQHSTWSQLSSCLVWQACRFAACGRSVHGL